MLLPQMRCACLITRVPLVFLASGAHRQSHRSDPCYPVFFCFWTCAAPRQFLRTIPTGRPPSYNLCWRAFFGVSDCSPRKQSPACHNVSGSLEKMHLDTSFSKLLYLQSTASIPSYKAWHSFRICAMLTKSCCEPQDSFRSVRTSSPSTNI